MGSSSSKPHYYDDHSEAAPPPLPRKHVKQQSGYQGQPPPAYLTAPAGYPPAANPGPFAPRPGTDPQFGYFIRQIGSDPNDVEVIPGYYYPAAEVHEKRSQRDPKRSQHKRRGSAPTLSTTLPAQSQAQEVRGGPPISPANDAEGQSPAEPPPKPADAPEPPPASPPPTTATPADPPAAPNPASASQNQPDPVPAASSSKPAPAPTTSPTSEQSMDSSSRRLKNPLPAPPKDVLSEEKYKDLRRSRTANASISSATKPLERPSAARTALSDPSHNARPANAGTSSKPTKQEAKLPQPPKLSHLPKHPVPVLPQPLAPQAGPSTSHAPPLPTAAAPRERRASTKKSHTLPDNQGSQKSSFNLFRFASLRGSEGKKLKKFTQPSTDPDYTGYPQPYKAPKYASSVPVPQYTPSPMDFPVDTGAPYVFYLHSNINPSSPHKVTYKNKLYPTAAHLFEAHKYLKHKPELAERIRVCSESASEMSMLSWEFQMAGHVRDDWEMVWREKLDEVLYLMFTQHPKLRAELMATGYAQLVDGNETRPHGVVDAPGVNELGKGLMRLRERLRSERVR